MPVLAANRMPATRYAMMANTTIQVTVDEAFFVATGCRLAL
jgi:hypothetical protein